MTYVNVGAMINDERVSAKKALRDALRNSPDIVVFDNTSMLGGGQSHYRGDELVTDLGGGVKLTVVGPDPYTDRRWYATVEITKTGAVKVS